MSSVARCGNWRSADNIESHRQHVGARKTLHVFGLAFALCFAHLVSSPVAAQWFEPVYRTQVDPTTGRRDRVIDAWETGRAEQEARDQEFDRQRQQGDANRAQADAEDARRRTERDALRDLSDQIYQTNVSTLNERHRRGLAKIRSGKADTTFVPQPGFSVAAYLARRFPGAQALIATHAQPANARFHQELRARGLSERDLADGQALAFITAFQVYSGQRPGIAHLNFARNIQRTVLMQSSIAQGADSAERERDFEMYGTLAFAALALAEHNDPLAKEIAGSVIAGLAQTAASSIVMTATGFAHRGDQIIASGKATAIFKPGPSLTPSYYGRQFSGQNVARSTFENNARETISAFYSELGRRGGNPRDLASIVAFLLAANATALTGQEPNRAQIQSTYEMARAAILRSRDIQAAPDADKQLAVELLMIRSVEALRDRNQLTARNNIQAIFRALGEDPNKYDLTPTGLRRRG